MSRPTTVRWLATPLISLALGGLTAAQEASVSSAEPAPPAEKASKSDSDKKERGRIRDLEVARMELKIAELRAQMDAMSADGAKSKAQRDAQEAEAALTHFIDNEVPVLIEKSTISLDRSRHSAEHAADELAELEAMYSAEEFAEMTKELVLRRGRRNLEIAQRNLAVEEAKLKMLTEEELPRKKRGLKAKLSEARAALAKAQLGSRKAELDNMVSLTKARNKILSLEEAAPTKSVDS